MLFEINRMFKTWKNVFVGNNIIYNILGTFLWYEKKINLKKSCLQ